MQEVIGGTLGLAGGAQEGGGLIPQNPEPALNVRSVIFEMVWRQTDDRSNKRRAQFGDIS
jgi:hypothetical protein